MEMGCMIIAQLAEVMLPKRSRKKAERMIGRK